MTSKDYLRLKVTEELNRSGIDYAQALQFMQNNKVFDDWTDYEMAHRPINIYELCECIAEQYATK